MKVLLYTSTIRATKGGVQLVFDQLGTGLEDRGHEVVRVWRESSQEGAADEWIVPLANPYFLGWKRTLRHAPTILKSTLRLAKALRHIQPDVVNLHFIRAEALYFVMLRRIFGYRLVLSFHGSDATGHRDIGGLMSHNLRRADAVTVVSDPLAESVRKLIRGATVNIDVIPNGIPLDFWTPPAGRRDNANSIIAVGRLEHVKGMDVLVSAMSRVHRAIPAAKLTVIGEGSALPALEAEVERLGLESTVIFLGRQPAEIVREHLQQANVFALPSRNEGFGIALIEAMACGVAPVAAAVGGVTDILTPDAGILVDPDDPIVLADALIAILKDPDRAATIGNAAARRARSYSLSEVIDSFERLYKRLM